MSISRLYQGRTSTASWRVRIALALKKIEYETVWVDLPAGEHRRAEYAAVAPTQQVPCLHVDGLRLVQSVAIIEYLDERYPNPPLLPPQPSDRAAVRQIVQIINSVIQPLQNSEVGRRLREQFDAGDGAVAEWSRYWIARRLPGLESVLRDTAGIYCFKDALSMADLFLLPQVERARDFGVDLSPFPTITRIASRLKDLPAFAASDPEYG